MTEQREKTPGLAKKFVTHSEILKSYNMPISHVCNFSLLSASLYFQNCISCFCRDERTSIP